MNYIEKLAQELYIKSLENEAESYREFCLADGEDKAWAEAITEEAREDYRDEANGIIASLGDFLEDIETKGYELGIVAGIEESAKYLDGEAALFFKGRMDKEARVTRTLSDKLMHLQITRRVTYDKKYPK